MDFILYREKQKENRNEIRRKISASERFSNICRRVGGPNAHSVVRGLTAMFPAKTTGTNIRVTIKTKKLVFLALGSLSRLNLRRSRDIGNRDITVNQTNENISDITVRLAPAEAYNITLKVIKESTETYGEPVTGMCRRNTLGTTRCKASWPRSSHVPTMPVKTPPQRTIMASTTIQMRNQ